MSSSATTNTNTSIEAEADKAVHLIFQNKINAKNAFDVNTDFVSTISKWLEKSYKKSKRSDESSWLRASASLDASAKIYGFRVD
jgi:hypothetical protein